MATLEAQEFRRFAQFVHSPFYTVHEDTVRLFDLIEDAHPDFTEEQIDSKRLFAALYPGEPYDDAQMRTLRKYLYRLLLQFLAALEAEQEPWFEERMQLASLSRRGNSKEFERLSEKYRAVQSEHPFRDADFFLQKFLYEYLVVNHQMTTGSRWAPKELSQSLEWLDHFYLAEKLKYGCTMVYHRRSSGSEGEPLPLLEAILVYCAQQLDRLPAIVQLYYHLFQLIDKPEAAAGHYQACRQMLNEEGERFSRGDQVTAFTHTINYCNRRYRQGEVDFLRDMLDIYRLMLARNLLFEGAKLSTYHYKNITTLGLRLGEYDWTEQFIHDYRERIDPGLRAGVFHYNLAHLYSYRGRYGEALRELQLVEFIDPFYRISYNLLLLKIYYENLEIEPLLALAQTFRTYIRRKEELTEGQQLSYLNFARFTRALFMIRTGKKHNLSKVEADIEAAKALIEKEWLRKKVAAIKELLPASARG